jgi:polyisoprenoid-binding protein YceI
MTSTTTFRTGTWTVQTALARFTARGLLGHTVIGTIDVLTGTLDIDADHHPHRLHVTLDPASINTGHTRRDKDLRGKRFLDVATHPTMSVAADKISPTPRGWQAPATLQVAGNSAPLLIDAELDDLPTDSHLRAHGTARVDLHDAGIKVPTLLVRRYVDITISAELVHTQ